MSGDLSRHLIVHQHEPHELSVFKWRYDIKGN